jgi:hypothetical protein
LNRRTARSDGLLVALLGIVLFGGCGGRSDLDTYSEGVPPEVPEPPGSSSTGLPGDGDGDGGSHGDGDGDGDGDAGSHGDGDAGTSGDTGGGKAKVGSACKKDTDCEGKGASCLLQLPVNIGITLTIDFPGGFCSIPGCSKDTDCPSGSGCVMGFAKPACTPLCAKNQDCRTAEGYTCAALPAFLSSDTRKICQPPVSIPGFGGGN